MRRGGLPLFIAPLVLLLAGCGLPDPFYLNPPVVSFASPLDNGFTMQNTDRSGEPDFRGYELYYKLYSDSAAIAADANLGAGTPGVDALVQKGFMALCRGPGSLPQDLSVEGRSSPLILIAPPDRSVAFQISIPFVPTTDSGTKVTYTSPTYASFSQELDRHVNGISRCKPFRFGAGNYLSSDQDIMPVWPPGSTLYIAMYVVSYGLQNLSTPIYSYPVYMGYLQLSNFVP